VAYRLPLFPTPSMYVVRRAMTEGLRGRSRFWKFVMITILLRRGFRRLMQSDGVTVAVERLKPGESIILRGVRARDLRS
jgi:hypothetical protein